MSVILDVAGGGTVVGRGVVTARPVERPAAVGDWGRDNRGLKEILLEKPQPVGRMENLEALRVVSMLAIVVTHVVGPFIRAAHASGVDDATVRAALAVSVAGRFGVPCFLCISFYIYWLQMHEKGRTWGELSKRRLLRILPAYFCWTAFYVVAREAVRRATGGEMIWNYHQARTWVEIWVWGRGEYHLYFLPVMVQCLVLLPVVGFVSRRAWTSWAMIAGVAAWWSAVAYGPFVVAAGTPAAGVVAMLAKHTHEHTALPLLVFPMFGMMCAGQRAWKRAIWGVPVWGWVGLFIAGMALHVAEALWLWPRDYDRATYFLKVGRMMSGCALFVLALRLDWLRNPWPVLSRYAFGMHFMHPFMILMIVTVETKLLGEGMWGKWPVGLLVANAVMTLGVTLAGCLLAGRWRRAVFLVV